MLTGTTARIENPLDFDIGKVYFYLFLFFALFLLIDPFYTGYGAFRVTRDIGPLKYTALLFGAGAFFFSLAGMMLKNPRAKQPPWRETLARAWPLLLFGLYMLGGALVARNYFDIQETFLPFAIGLVGLPLAMVLFWSVNQRMLVARRFMQALLLIMPVVIGWVVVKRMDGGQAFHIEIFLFVPLGVYFFLALKQRWLGWLILLTTIFLAVVSFKNTAFLVLLLCLVYLMVLGLVRRPAHAASLRRVLVVYGLLASLMAGVAGVTFLLQNRETYLPTGNVEARSITYEAAYLRFLDSPLVGTGYSGSSLVDLNDFTVLGNDTLVTHSDLLDILSHGGLLGAGLFVVGLYRLFSRVVQALRSKADQDTKVVIHGLLLIVVSGLVVAAFNSPLITLTVGVMFWFAVGLLFAAAEYALRQPAATPGRV